jgi:hypothetical protein
VRDFKLKEGLAAETSGGLFVLVPPESVNDFMNELKSKYN